MSGPEIEEAISKLDGIEVQEAIARLDGIESAVVKEVRHYGEGICLISVTVTGDPEAIKGLTSPPDE